MVWCTELSIPVYIDDSANGPDCLCKVYEADPEYEEPFFTEEDLAVGRQAIAEREGCNGYILG